MIKFGYTIIYVNNVEENLEFFEKTFDIKRRFLHECGDYGELDTGSTVLAFAGIEVGESNVPGGCVYAEEQEKPLGVEIALVCEDVEAIHQVAINNGSKEVSPPIVKPWGQTVSYLTSPHGILLEICTPVGG